MGDDLVERLRDWPYMGETYAKEAADRIEALERERDALKEWNANQEKMIRQADLRGDTWKSRAEVAEQLVAKLERAHQRHLISGAETRQRAEAAEQLVATLEAALATARADAWQPIKTAPKDGIVLLFDGTMMVIGRWRRGSGVWATDAHWLTDAVLKPTHWMPLPAPPALIDGGRNG